MSPQHLRFPSFFHAVLIKRNQAVMRRKSTECQHKILVPGCGLGNCNHFFILIDQFKTKSDWGTNKCTPILLDSKLQVKCHAYPIVMVVFTVFSSLSSPTKPLIGANLLHLQVYHCPHLFSLPEADICKPTWSKSTAKPTQLACPACLTAS